MQNIGSDLIRGNIDTIILKTMLDGDKYGLDIIKEVEARSNGTYELKQPTLYSCLKRLENQELISSYWLDSDIGGRRHYYKLTEKGRDFYNKKQEEWAKSKFIIDNLLSNFNYDEYRLVKKDDYDKIIENKQPDFSENATPVVSAQEEVAGIAEENLDYISDEQSPATIQDEPLQSEDELEIDLNEHLEDSNQTGDTNFEAVNDESDVEDFNNIEESADEDEFDTDDINEPIVQSVQPLAPQDPERKYFVNLYDDETPAPAEKPAEPEKDYTASESNILSKLRFQNDEEINTYVGDQQSYLNHLNQAEEEPEVIQDSLLDMTGSDDDYLEDKINEFNENIEELNNFDSSLDEEIVEDEETDEDLYSETIIDVDEEIHEDDTDEHFDLTQSDDVTYNTSFENFKEDKPCACYEDDFNDLDELSNSSASNYFSSNDDIDYEQTQIVSHKPYEPEYFDEDTNLTNSSDASFEFNDYNSASDSYSNMSDDDFGSFETNEVSETTSYDTEDIDSYNFPDLDETNDDLTDDETYSSVTTTNNQELSGYSFDDIISRNINSTPVFTQQTFEQNETFIPKYTGNSYKEKLANLSNYSKVSEEKSVETDATRKAKDIGTLKSELEQEGIKIKEYKKYGSNEQAEKSYLLVNKINFINSLILLFGYVFILSAVFIILNNTGFKDTYNFHFKYFALGFIPFAAIAIYYTALFIINPYKKVPAKYAPRIMIFISVIITIQLLLITYCVNLQLGFYSFTQSGYNHLIWLVPTIISFAPMLYTASYIALFYSKNFNI